MAKLEFFCFMIAAAVVCQVAAQAEECELKLINLVQELQKFPELPTDINDLSVLMFTGKGLYDMGTKELCDLLPDLHYVMATPAQPAYIGVCIYKECSVETLNTLKDQAAQFLPFPVEFYDHSLKQEVKDYTRAGFIGTCVVIALLVVCGIVGMVVQYTSLFDSRGYNAQNIPSEPAKRNDKQIVKSKNTGGLFFLAFSFTRNWSKLMSTAGGGQGYDENLDVFAGVRTFSMMYVILGHWQSFQLSTRSYDQLGEYQSWYGIFMQGGEYAVDAFFCMAAFLGTYVLLGKLSKSNSICFNFPLAYFHRWYRLIPTLAFVTLLIMYLFTFMVQGPVAPAYYYSMVQSCQKYWWPNFLFINNFYPWDLGKECIGQVWYLANDYQFFLITPFLLMLMRINKMIAYLVNILLILLSIMASMVVVYHYDIRVPAINEHWQNDYYNKPYCRLAAYMVGVLIAQLYYDRKLAKSGDQSAQRSCGNFVFMLYAKSGIVAWASVLIGIFWTSFLIFYYQRSFHEQWTLGASMAWTALSRPVYVFGMMLVLLPTFEGRLPWLKLFMSCDLFKVVGKLTYSAYLIHIAVMGAYMYSKNNSELESRDGGIFLFFGIYTLSYFAALIITLLVELPTLNIEKTILFPPKVKASGKAGVEPLTFKTQQQYYGVNEQASTQQQSDDEIHLNGSNGYQNGHNGFAINGASSSSQNGHNGLNGHNGHKTPLLT